LDGTVGKLHDWDFESFEWIQEDELQRWAKVMEN